jgi:type 2 lantibiotic biosynthesis protein LanM
LLTPATGRRIIDAAGYAHLGVSWSGTQAPRLKSYVMVTTRGSTDAAGSDLVTAAAIRAGVPWPDRLRWAAGQLPLVDGDEAARMDAWHSALGDNSPAGTSGALAQRLTRSGLTGVQAQVAVGDVPSPAEPDWLPWFVLLRHAVQAPGPSAPDDEAPALDWLADIEDAMPHQALPVPFSPVWWPAVEAAWADLASRHGDLLTRVTPSAVLSLQLDLLSRLAEISAPTLAAHLSADLTYGQQLLHRLGDPPTDAPRERFAHLCRQLAGGGLDDLLLAHPVLPSLLGTAARQWHTATVELLARVDRHRGDLAHEFGVPGEAELTGLTVSAGDRHNDGRAVAVLAFGDARVVYKPRDVRLEHLWWRVVEEVSPHAPGVLRAARVLPVDDGRPYGFCEFVDHRPASTPDELARFYRSAGSTLALLLALSATDCHYENLVAHGDHLVLIDAEALFETRDGEAAGEAPARGTVMQVGMLPSWLWMEGSRTALDVSALGCTTESILRTTPIGWRAVNTDAMCRGPVSVQVPHPTSLPTPPGRAPDLDAHAEDLVAGFRDGYRAVLAARDRLLAEVVGPAAGLRRRLILRPTYVYAVLLAQSVDPAALRSVADRGMVLERLARLHLGADETAWPLLEAEQRAMARLDVPLFEAALSGGRTSWADGHLEGWPADDAISAVAVRLAAMDQTDLAWQERLIRSALAARRLRPSAFVPAGVAGSEPRQPGGTKDPGPASVTDRIRGQLGADALHDRGAVTWMTLAMLPDGEHVTVQRLGPGLYDGVLGVALSLDRLGDPALARSALRPLLEALDPTEPERVRRLAVSAGLGWSGVGGHLRALRVLEQQGILETAEAETAIGTIVAAVSTEAIARDRWLDVMNGAAGIIRPLAAEIRRRPAGDPVRERCRAILERAASHLVTRQLTDGGWPTLPSSAPLTGLAHGASGIAVALAEAAEVLTEPAYLDAAARGLAYEASVFDPAAGNWPDFREGSRGEFMLGWCAGAPGIALTRMRMLDLAADHPAADRWSADLAVAAQTTAQAPLLGRDHLCCGNLGRAAVLRLLGVRTSTDTWVESSRSIITAVLDEAGTGVPRTFLGDAPAGVIAVPGLMTGVSGAGALLADENADWLDALLL